MFPVKMISSCTWLLKFRKSSKGFPKKPTANHPTIPRRNDPIAHISDSMGNAALLPVTRPLTKQQKVDVRRAVGLCAAQSFGSTLAIVPSNLSPWRWPCLPAPIRRRDRHDGQKFPKIHSSLVALMPRIAPDLWFQARLEYVRHCSRIEDHIAGKCKPAGLPIIRRGPLALTSLRRTYRVPTYTNVGLLEESRA